MKKLLVGLMAAFLMAAGLVAVTGSGTASAKTCPYTGCIPTDTQVRAFSPKPRKLKARAAVSAGNTRVTVGRIKIQVKGNDKYRQRIKPAKSPTKAAFRLPPGIYLVQAKYIPGQSRYRRSAESTIVTVKGRRR